MHIFLKICFVISFYMTDPPLPNKKEKVLHGVRNIKKKKKKVTC